MPGEGRSRGIVTHIAPDLSYLTVKDRSGGRKAYLSNASETIKRLGLNTQTEKRVSFTYKQGGPTEMKEIEYVERDIPGDVRTPTIRHSSPSPLPSLLLTSTAATIADSAIGQRARRLGQGKRDPDGMRWGLSRDQRM